KRLLEYDDVMNIQREAIYKKRRNALSGERLAVDLNAMFRSQVENLVYKHKDNGDFESFRREALGSLGIDVQMDAADFKEGLESEVVERIEAQFLEFYNRKGSQVAALLLPEIKNVYETRGNQYKRIVVPFSDGRSQPLAITADIENAVKSKGKSIIHDIEKAVSLLIIDEKWKEHLRAMDELKDSVQAASFEQKDPLVIYKMEAFNLFEQLIFDINEAVTAYLAKGQLVMADGRPLEQAREQRTDLSRTRAGRPSTPTSGNAADAARAAAEGVSTRQKVETIRRTEEKISRNAPCPCGSGKKYKNCHGKSA
ncbi:MAG TPA: SEC-C metal-binding domain-containing protein, partial [Saprospiraceae bacterium]|nr:SEC-C metal-binding domain-containing protein [Saprospiraceae bacterium]